MAEEREARGTRHRGATAVRAEITPVRGASQHQMVSRRDPYLHLQRGRRVNAGEQRHSRQVTCVFSDIFYIRNSARTAFFSDRDRAGGEALRDSPLFSSFLLFERARRFWLRFIAFFSVRGGVKGVNFEGGGVEMRREVRLFASSGFLSLFFSFSFGLETKVNSKLIFNRKNV